MMEDLVVVEVETSSCLKEFLHHLQMTFLTCHHECINALHTCWKVKALGAVETAYKGVGNTMI